VKFIFDPETLYVTSSRSSTIAVMPGGFQREPGCP
jgi:hypothetical protein